MSNPERLSHRQPEEWRELLRECVLCGILFKAAMADLHLLGTIPLRLRYDDVLVHISRWAERRHHQLRRLLADRGCFILKSEKQGECFSVLVRRDGYVREAVYSIELLQAECRRLIREWVQQQGGGDK